MEGVKLAILHPLIAYRSCEHCLAYLYEENTGKPLEKNGEPVPRPKGTAPCQVRKNGCPKGTPQESKALTAANTLAYQHYAECRAVNQWPDDSIVRRHAALIRAAEDVAIRTRDFESVGPLAGLLSRGR